MTLSRSGFDLNEIWRKQTLCLEADARLRSLERTWQESGSPIDGKRWAREALRAGQHPLEVGKRLFRGHPDAHKEVADELRKSRPGSNHHEHQTRLRNTHAPFELPALLHNYVQAVNTHDDYIHNAQKQHREDPNTREYSNEEYEKLRHMKGYHRSVFRQAVHTIHPKPRIEGMDDKARKAHKKANTEQTRIAARYAMQHHPHKDNRSKLRVLADLHDAGHQDSHEIAAVREEEGAQDHVHHLDVDPTDSHHSMVKEGELMRGIEEHFPKAKLGIENRRLRHHYSGTRYLRVELPKKD